MIYDAIIDTRYVPIRTRYYISIVSMMQSFLASLGSLSSAPPLLKLLGMLKHLLLPLPMPMIPAIIHLACRMDTIKTII